MGRNPNSEGGKTHICCVRDGGTGSHVGGVELGSIRRGCLGRREGINRRESGCEEGGKIGRGPCLFKSTREEEGILARYDKRKWALALTGVIIRFLPWVAANRAAGRMGDCAG